VTAARVVPFNQPHLTGREYERIKEAVDNRFLCGNGPFTARCQAWLERTTGSRRALLTHSCTGALEMAAILIDVGPGDEVIMPSFTFVSTANAFVLRGATPVFVDIRGHAQPRRTARRRSRDVADTRDRARPLRWCGLRHGGAHHDRRPP
jgi:dTDP-4-amino-4,6-dideoxygalactose transaminase